MELSSEAAKVRLPAASLPLPATPPATPFSTGGRSAAVLSAADGTLQSDPAALEVAKRLLAAARKPVLILGLETRERRDRRGHSTARRVARLPGACHLQGDGRDARCSSAVHRRLHQRRRRIRNRQPRRPDPAGRLRSGRIAAPEMALQRSGHRRRRSPSPGSLPRADRRPLRRRCASPRRARRRRACRRLDRRRTRRAEARACPCALALRIPLARASARSRSSSCAVEAALPRVARAATHRGRCRRAHVLRDGVLAEHRALRCADLQWPRHHGVRAARRDRRGAAPARRASRSPSPATAVC